MNGIARIAVTIVGLVLTTFGCGFLVTALFDPSPPAPRSVAAIAGVLLVAASFAVYRFNSTKTTSPRS